MKKCIAYRALGSSASRWVPCGTAAERNSNFCKKHGDAVIGGVLGLWTAGLLEPHAAGNFKMDGKTENAKSPDARRCSGRPECNFRET